MTRGPGLRTWGTAQRDVALKKHPKKLTLTPVVPGVAFAPHAAILRTNRADEARQHAGEQRPLARRVVHGLPPRNDARRDGMAGSRSGAGVRAADGVHALRDHRRRYAAKLARASAAAKPCGRAMALNAEQRRALVIIADAGFNGCTEAMLRVQGFSIGLLSRLVRDDLVTVTPERVRIGGELITVAKFRITEAGRQAVAC